MSFFFLLIRQQGRNRGEDSSIFLFRYLNMLMSYEYDLHPCLEDHPILDPFSKWSIGPTIYKHQPSTTRWALDPVINGVKTPTSRVFSPQANPFIFGNLKGVITPFLTEIGPPCKDFRS